MADRVRRSGGRGRQSYGLDYANGPTCRTAIQKVVEVGHREHHHTNTETVQKIREFTRK